ncbi:DUF6612 family protein [Cohnella luojiensis]|uniref:LppX_LprAFG lipoprotein n=1 Tax=Cohnella luojiensis TaxID=652876 RepID=A0A4Y8M3B3_9BACL|nr:DUF6612 family protein [Cohnella luojiensis]TFE28938.1 hypothetical protein E2980_05965 [Cohnella luojiensis]
MVFHENYRQGYRYYSRLVLLAAILCLTAGCTADAPGPASPTAGPTSSVTEWLDKAETAAGQMANYAFELHLNQQLSGESDEDRSNVKIDMQGRVERSPLKLDQTIKSDIDGEKSTLRAIVVPDAYYMYLPEYEEWNKLGKEVAAENVATLSDFQVDPKKALQNIRALGNALAVEPNEKRISVNYEGVGEEASSFVARVLGSTLGLSGTETEIKSSLALRKLKVSMNLDAEKHWPLSYRIESDFTIELEPGRKTVVSQALAGTYNKHNATAAITVPKEALKALDPDEMDEQLDLQ